MGGGIFYSVEFFIALNFFYSVEIFFIALNFFYRLLLKKNFDAIKKISTL